MLLRFLRTDLVEEVCGDLEENFHFIRERTSLFAANCNYWYQVLNYLRPFAMRRSKSFRLNSYGMYRNYFRISFRNLLRQKLYSVINIGGLSLGLTCFIIAMLYVQHELSYDLFYKNADRIYRIYQRQIGNVHLGTDQFAVTPALLPSVLHEECPEVEYATSVAVDFALLTFDDHHFYERGLAADPNFFNVFAIPFLQGNPTRAFDDPVNIVITASLAEKIFGTRDPIGQFVNYQNGEPFAVTGVIADPPSNSSLQYSFIVNLLSNTYYSEEIKKTTWNNNAFHTFFLLSEGADPAQLQSKFPALIKKYRDSESYASYPFKDHYRLQNIGGIHLETGVNDDIGLKGNKQYVYLFSAVALIVLLLACVNYMNLAIARSIKRAREVGLRKVVGALRSQIIFQFLGESVLIAFLSLLLAVGLTHLLLPVFGRLMERPIEIDYLANRLLLPALLLLVTLVGLLSGSYPAFVMSSLRPVEILKGKNSGLTGSKVQRVLLVAQYAVAITLVISSIVIYTQLRFVQEKELGYDRRNVITIPVRDYSLVEGFETLRIEWQKNPAILESSYCTSLPINVTSSHIINDEVGAGTEDDIAIYESRVDYGFLDVFGITLLTGRNFSRDVKSDGNSAYLINETAAKALGWTPEEAVGKQIVDDGPKTIIGVIKDFHMHSMHLQIQPLILKVNRAYVNYIAVKVTGEDLPETISFLKKTIAERSPYPFEYQFLDERFDQLYKSELKLGEIFGVFTVLSILIASLGLFGLAAFMSGQRTKEIGIRKVLGASIQNIMTLLTKDFLVMVGLAFVISVPIAWLAMRAWLQEFAYRINMEWWMFGVAGILAAIIAGITISHQSLRASMMDPVESLRSE